jgi:hypothetical protein
MAELFCTIRADVCRREFTQHIMRIPGFVIALVLLVVNAAAHAGTLQACGGCDVQYAQQLGADLAITGLVRVP